MTAKLDKKRANTDKDANWLDDEDLEFIKEKEKHENNIFMGQVKHIIETRGYISTY